jgi:Golgi phosphoprotein 3
VLVKDPNQQRYPVAAQLVQVINDRQTGKMILDEVLKMMKAQESDRMGINSWIDLLSGRYPYSMILPSKFLSFHVSSNV